MNTCDPAGRIAATLKDLLAIPSPSGGCEAIGAHVTDRLRHAGWQVERTADGAVLARRGGRGAPLVLAAHLDTLGAQVMALKENGRLALVSVGTWSARFAEGARARVGGVTGTILPLKASGHAYDEEVDRQPVCWSQVELRLDIATGPAEAGIRVGDLVSIDPQPEFLPNGYIVSRHLDDKAAVAVLLTLAEDVGAGRVTTARPLVLAFSVSEELGTGASQFAGLGAADAVGLDIGIVAEGQASREDAIAVCMGDSGGPYDRSLSLRVLEICEGAGIPCGRDVFRHYYSDLTAMKRAGGVQRMALLTFGTDASHGYERTHIRSLIALHRAVAALAQAEPG